MSFWTMSGIFWIDQVAVWRHKELGALLRLIDILNQFHLAVEPSLTHLTFGVFWDLLIGQIRLQRVMGGSS